MVHMFLDSGPWFRAKSHGYGAGLPIAWQGWLLLALHVGLIVGLAILFRDRPLPLMLSVLAAALLPMPIYAAKTEDGWRWRWGDRDQL